LKGKMENELVCLRASNMEEGRDWITRITERLGARFSSISLAKPSLDDVFVSKAGRSWHDEEKVS